jgi:hypothetical protein
MNQPARQSDGGIYPRKNHQQQIVENAKYQHAQSAMHSSVVVNAAINAAKHDQLPAKQKAKTVLDALEHRTLTAAWARQQQEKQEKQELQHKAQAMFRLQREKLTSGQEAATKLLKTVKMVVGSGDTNQQQDAGVTDGSEQHAENKRATDDSKQPTRERTGAPASDSMQKPQDVHVREGEEETSLGDNSNKNKESKEKKEKKPKANKAKTKKGRKKTAAEEL